MISELCNYTSREIALISPYKQRAIILLLPVVCNCPRPRPLLGGISEGGFKVDVTLLLPQMAENSDTSSAMLGENELQQLSYK